MLEYGVECLLGLRAQILQRLPHGPIQGSCHGPVREMIEEFLAEFEDEMRPLQMLNVWEAGCSDPWPNLTCVRLYSCNEMSYGLKLGWGELQGDV